MNVLPLLAYLPFVTPLPLWDYWMWLLLPLVVAVAIVYKSVRCPSMALVPRQAAAITFWMLAGLAGTGLALALIVWGMERAGI